MRATAPHENDARRRVTFMASKTQAARRIQRLRYASVAFVSVIGLAIVAYGIYYATAKRSTDAFVEGTDYILLDNAAPKGAPGPVVVREFFSYYCIHCRNFDPIVEQWRTAAHDGVRFERSPVSFSPLWSTMARGFYALETVGALAENHERIFHAIHEGNQQFPTPESIAEFVDGHGTTRDAFLAAYRSTDVLKATNEADARARATRIDSVPSLTVGDRYRVNMDAIARTQAFAVVDFLVAKVRAEH